MTNKVFSFLLFIILALLLIAAIMSLPNWATFPEWSGFQDKKAWDLLDLLIVPAALAIGATLYSQSQRKTELQIETERQRESALQAYIDRIKDLVIELYTAEVETNEDSNETPEVIEALGNIGAAYTRATLQQLDARRKGMLLEFLYDTHLIGWTEPHLEEQYIQIIYLGESADFSGLVINTPALRGVNLSFTNLSKSKLVGLDLLQGHFTGCNMSNSTFIGVNFWGADLGGANLFNSKMRGCVLEKVDLRSANLKNADLRDASMNEANLEFAKYNKKTQFPKNFDPIKAKMIFEK